MPLPTSPPLHRVNQRATHRLSLYLPSPRSSSVRPIVSVFCPPRHTCEIQQHFPLTSLDTLQLVHRYTIHLLIDAEHHTEETLLFRRLSSAVALVATALRGAPSSSTTALCLAANSVHGDFTALLFEQLKVDNTLYIRCIGGQTCMCIVEEMGLACTIQRSSPPPSHP